MASLGEIEILVNSSIVGRIRALTIGADPALFPRLAITVGVTLYLRQDDRSPIPAPDDLEMRDASGELRVAELSDTIGSVAWAGPRRFVRASNYGSESQLRFVCDLDHQRLELIERRRAGGAPVFWLQLWPVLVSGGRFLDAEARAFPLKVSREDWLQFYTEVGGGQFDVIEVQYSAQEAEQFKRAVGRVQEARARIAIGDSDGAVSLCRNAIEALKHELAPSDEDPLKALLERRTDDKRATEYLGIVSRLKQLSGFAHHEFGTPMTFTRAEAQFIVRTTESLLALLGRLSQLKT